MLSMCVCVHVCGFVAVVAVVAVVTLLKLLVCNLKHVHYLKSSENNLDNISFLKKSKAYLIIHKHVVRVSQCYHSCYPCDQPCVTLHAISKV